MSLQLYNAITSLLQLRLYYSCGILYKVDTILHDGYDYRLSNSKQVNVALT